MHILVGCQWGLLRRSLCTPVRTEVDIPAPLIHQLPRTPATCFVREVLALPALQTGTCVGPKCNSRNHKGIGACQGALTAQEGGLAAVAGRAGRIPSCCAALCRARLADLATIECFIHGDMSVVPDLLRLVPHKQSYRHLQRCGA